MIRFPQVFDIGYWGLFYHGEAGVVTDEFRDLSGLFQPLQFYDSTSGPSCPINSGPSEIQS